MAAIGFRSETDCVRWAVVTGTADEPVLVGSGKLRPPKILAYPADLSWYREQVLLLVERFGAVAGGVRHPESVRQGGQKMFPRVRVDAVVAEALNAAPGIGKVVCGPLATISSAIGSGSAKGYIGTDELRGLDWSRLSKLDREAILMATAALGTE